MENNERKGNGVLIVIIIILLLGLLGTIGYIVYDKVVNKEETKTENKIGHINKNIQKEEVDIENNILKVVDELLNNNADGTYKYMDGTYLRGKTDLNYVQYNEYLWRIMGKNSDGTIRLITDKSVTEMVYCDKYQELNYSTSKGFINDWLNKEFLSKLDNRVQNSKWCNEPSKYDDVSHARAICSSDKVFDAKVGMITNDEFLLSEDQRSNDEFIKSGWSQRTYTNYLVNGENYWTLTPSLIAGNPEYANNYIYIPNFGSSYGTEKYRVRPIVNLIGNSIIANGNGTKENPYIIEALK